MLRFRVMRFVTGVLFVLLLSAAPGAQTGGLTKQDLASINDATAALEKAIASRNGKAAGALYADNAQLYAPGFPVVQGRAGIEGALALLGALSNLTLKNTGVDGRGDVAYVQGTFTATLPPSGAANAQPAVGYFLDVRRKQADGRWLIVVQMLSGGGR